MKLDSKKQKSKRSSNGYGPKDQNVISARKMGICRGTDAFKG
jgi:hypothetical protein